LAQFSYNAKKQTSTKKSPFEVTCSYTPRMGIEQRSSKAPAADLMADKINETLDQINETLDQVRNNLKQAQERMKSNADKHHSEAPKYSLGDKVWLSTDNLCL
ncbi:hypothetical protein OG21DRAFT_1396676, partial [Imleria badia]